MRTSVPPAAVPPAAVPPPPMRVVTSTSTPVSSSTPVTVARIGVGTPITTVIPSGSQAATGPQASAPTPSPPPPHRPPWVFQAVNSRGGSVDTVDASGTRPTSSGSSHSEEIDSTAWRRAVIAMVDSMEGCSTEEVVTKMSEYLHGVGDTPQDESQELVRLWAAEVIAEVKARASKNGQASLNGALHGRELPRAWLQLGEELLLGARDGSKTPDLSPGAAATALQGPVPSILRDRGAWTLDQVLVCLEAGWCRHAELAAVVGALTQRVDRALGVTNGDAESAKDVKVESCLSEAVNARWREDGSAVTLPSKLAEVSLDGEPNPANLARTVGALNEEVRAIAASVSALSLRVEPLEVGRQREIPAAPQDTDDTGAAPTEDQKQDCSDYEALDAADVPALLRSLREERELVTAMAHGLRHEKAEVLAALRGLRAERKEVTAEREALEHHRTAMLEAAKDLRAARDAAAGAVLDLRNEHCEADMAAKRMQERLITLASAGAAAAAAKAPASSPVAAGAPAADACAASTAEDNRRRAAANGLSEPAVQGPVVSIEKVAAAVATGEATSKRPGSTSPFRSKRSPERNRPVSPPTGALPTGSSLPLHPAAASNSTTHPPPIGVSAPTPAGASMGTGGATAPTAKLVQAPTNGGSARLSGPGAPAKEAALLQQAAAAATNNSPRSSSLGRSQAEGMRKRGVKSSVSPRNSPSPRDTAENREHRQRYWPPSRCRRTDQTAGRTSISNRMRADLHPSWPQ